MGGAKPAALLGGRPLVAHAIAALRGLCDEVVVVAKRATALPEELGAAVWFDDERADFHPRHGIVTALRGAAGGPVLVVAVDMPYARPALEAVVAAGAPTAVARARGRLQPLCARYAPSTLDAFASAGDTSLTRIVLGLDPAIVDVPARTLTNINSPADLEG